MSDKKSPNEYGEAPAKLITITEKKGVVPPQIIPIQNQNQNSGDSGGDTGSNSNKK